MALVEILMPRMGESVMEGTILSWLKQVGEYVEEDESLLEVATDKVDTDIPSPTSGTIKEILAQEGDVIQIDKPIAIIETEKEATDSATTPEPTTEPVSAPVSEPIEDNTSKSNTTSTEQVPASTDNGSSTLLEAPIRGRFYSPLVLNIARAENISLDILERIPGTGKEGRVTKKDILAYVTGKKQAPSTSPVEEKASTPEPAPEKFPVPNLPKATPAAEAPSEEKPATKEPEPVSKPAISVSGKDEIIEMNRMRKIIAERMLKSRQTSAHVTSFVEADVTNIVYWRNRVKQDFKDKENTLLTYTPIFIEAVIKAIKDYPMINVSIDGDYIIKRGEINIGIAVALPDGNLIVPVIKNADQLNIIGLTKQVNDLAKRARAGKLKPEELEGGTYTVSNVGSFGNVMGTPILVQPQVGILALGAVVKKPAVIETDQGDSIGIRHMMMLSHSYDHRVVDGSLGGMFVRRVADYLERFDIQRQMYQS